MKCTVCDTSYIRFDTKGCVTDCRSIGEYKGFNTPTQCFPNCFDDDASSVLGINGECVGSCAAD